MPVLTVSVLVGRVPLLKWTTDKKGTLIAVLVQNH